MTSLSTNHLAFPGNFSPLTERRLSAQAWPTPCAPTSATFTLASRTALPQLLRRTGETSS